MTKSEASKLEEKPDLKLVRALQKDFKALYSPQYTANHKAKQMLINLEISIMRLDNIESLISKQRQEAVVSVLKDLVSIEYPPSGKQYHFRDGSWSNTLAWVAGHLEELESKEEASE